MLFSFRCGILQTSGKIEQLVAFLINSIFRFETFYLIPVNETMKSALKNRIQIPMTMMHIISNS